ncbi:phosphotransferase family protein [Paenibacillus sp. OV219]|uniref:phosphotransferase family protein n=1 Tax=Paenibacillus sp. OV219 TaxID=1884377 RepID=UPI0008AB20ED|nr:phosphotransferase [Paenibacillus sp. OV219]SEN97823.1 Phosphotransferase enzyme family protein [Paenibacillus sp. OV219]
MLKLFTKDELLSQVVSFVETIGLTEVMPVVLSDGGNLIIHLAPHPVVARISTFGSIQVRDHAYTILNRELHVANYLRSYGVPVLSPAERLGTTPYNVNGTWLTLWNYEPWTELQALSPSESVQLVSLLSGAMRHYPGELPVLGVWERSCQSALRLAKQSDLRIRSLLHDFQETNEQIRSQEMFLVPCHGDAHKGNLLPSPSGWKWMDFEDVSLMPIHWDMASYVGNLVLFGGLQEPTFRFMLEQLEQTAISINAESFTFTVSARILMSTLGNLDYALEGHGDLPFATRQLELAEGILSELKRLK